MLRSLVGSEMCIRDSKWGGSRGRPSRLRYNRCMTCVCMHVCALHSPPVRCMVAQASCAVGGVITVRKKSSSASYTSSIRTTRKKQSCRNQPAPYAPQAICYDSFLLSVRASVPIHERSRAVLARGTFESIAVTNICTNTLYYRTAVELLPDGNIELSLIHI